jgi:microcystin-dependent protein
MLRPFLALCLLSLATTSLANTVAASGDPAVDNAKAGKSTATGTQDGDAVTASPAAVAPARASTPHTTSPRWHSMLPGMIR